MKAENFFQFKFVLYTLHLFSYRCQPIILGPFKFLVAGHLSSLLRIFNLFFLHGWNPAFWGSMEKKCAVAVYPKWMPDQDSRLAVKDFVQPAIKQVALTFPHPYFLFSGSCHVKSPPVGDLTCQMSELKTSSFTDGVTSERQNDSLVAFSWQFQTPCLQKDGVHQEYTPYLADRKQ